MYRRSVVLLAAVALFAAGASDALAQDKGGKKGYKRHSKFQKLGKNIALELTMEQAGGSEMVYVVTASNRFSAERVDSEAKLELWGQISIDEKGYLVTLNVKRWTYGERKEGQTDLHIQASALLENGGKLVVGKSGGTTYSLKLSEL